jgi:hypothetical protein
MCESVESFRDIGRNRLGRLLQLIAIFEASTEAGSGKKRIHPISKFGG